MMTNRRIICTPASRRNQRCAWASSRGSSQWIRSRNGSTSVATADEFEEAAACVIRVSQPRGSLNQRRATEEIANLHDHESQEEQIEQAQHQSHFDGTKGEGREAFLRGYGQFLPKQQSSQVPTDAQGNERDHHEVGEVNMQDAVDEVLEDGVRCHEERAENQHGQKGKRSAAQHCRAASGLAAERLLPFGIPKEEGEHSERGIKSCDEAAQSIFHQAGSPQVAALGSQHHQRQSCQQPQQVERAQSQRVVPQESEGKEQDRQQQPVSAPCESGASGAAQENDRSRECACPQREIHSPGEAPEERVAQNSQCERRCDNR